MFPWYWRDASDHTSSLVFPMYQWGKLLMHCSPQCRFHRIPSLQPPQPSEFGLHLWHPQCMEDTFHQQPQLFYNRKLFICWLKPSLLMMNYCILSLAAVYIVPGNFGCASAVFAAITTFAPSFAAFKAIALPIPLLAPVMKMVRPASFLTIWE